MKRILFLTALAALFVLPAFAQEKQSPSFDEVLTTRRSIRSYDATKTISEQEVRTLMEVTPEKLAAVQELIGGNKRNVQGAPVLIISTFERGKSGFFQGNAANEVGDGWGAYDNGLSNCYLILQARAMGFDTLIMGMRNADKLRSLFNIPENETIMAVIALGYRKNQPVQPRHKQLDDVVKFY